jgi:hypothetical protein
MIQLSNLKLHHINLQFLARIIETFTLQAPNITLIPTGKCMHSLIKGEYLPNDDNDIRPFYLIPPTFKDETSILDSELVVTVRSSWLDAEQVFLMALMLFFSGFITEFNN